jgi:uncharacterized membrane protein YfcA
MITWRTRLLLLATAACGVGIGILAPWSDGLYSAMLLFMFPLLVAVAAVAVGTDLNKTSVKTEEASLRKRQRVTVAKPSFGATSIRQT